MTGHDRSQRACQITARCHRGVARGSRTSQVMTGHLSEGVADDSKV